MGSAVRARFLQNFQRQFNFEDVALASDPGDVELCRIEALQRIQYVGGTRVVCRDPAVDFLHFLGTVACQRS